MTGIVGVCVAIVVISLVVTTIVALFKEYILPFLIEGWNKGRGRARRKPQFSITADTRLFKRVVHWGNTIRWKDYGQLRMCGFRSRNCPRPGDLLVSDQQSGQKILFWFKTFERPWSDPPDYFEATMVPYSYVYTLSEDDAAWYAEQEQL